MKINNFIGDNFHRILVGDSSYNFPLSLLFGNRSPEILQCVNINTRVAQLVSSVDVGNLQRSINPCHVSSLGCNVTRDNNFAEGPT